eukprot:INCI15051.1.p1 GENE.INCI15051.1~~INCI15051.1.p1  ORF type:complete len:138 (-),score=10.61 INCI15051.1:333-746(-)
MVVAASVERSCSRGTTSCCLNAWPGVATKVLQEQLRGAEPARVDYCARLVCAKSIARLCSFFLAHSFCVWASDIQMHFAELNVYGGGCRFHGQEFLGLLRHFINEHDDGKAVLDHCPRKLSLFCARNTERAKVGACV